MATRRRFWRSLVYERDGSLNLSWVILLIYTLLSVVAVGFALMSRNPLAIGFALSFLAVTINLFALGAFSQNKAKIVEIVRNIEDAGFSARRRNMHYEVLGEPIFREREVPRMLELATAREEGDDSVPAELMNYPARSRAGKQLRVVPS